MTAKRTPPETRHSEGLYNHTHTTADAIDYVLHMTTRYLLENAYGDYRLTVSHRIEDTARMVAICAYAGHARRRISSSARANRARILTVCERGVSIPSAVAALAGMKKPGKPLAKAVPGAYRIHIASVFDVSSLWAVADAYRPEGRRKQ